jgi:hypothetical protein
MSRNYCAHGASRMQALPELLEEARVGIELLDLGLEVIDPPPEAEATTN